MNFLKKHLFGIISWLLTLAVVAGVLLIAYANKNAFVEEASTVFIEATPTEISNAAPDTSSHNEAAPGANANAIRRQITLKTRIPEDRPTYSVKKYTVARGDSTFSIATEHGIEPETLLWANYDTLEDSPDSLRVGQ